MREKFRLILAVVLFIILIFIVASLIRDFMTFIIGDKLNNFWFSIINIIFIFLFIELLFKTNPGKYIEERLFKKRRSKRLK